MYDRPDHIKVGTYYTLYNVSYNLLQSTDNLFKFKINLLSNYCISYYTLTLITNEKSLSFLYKQNSNKTY